MLREGGRDDAEELVVAQQRHADEDYQEDLLGSETHEPQKKDAEDQAGDETLHRVGTGTLSTSLSVTGRAGRRPPKRRSRFW